MRSAGMCACLAAAALFINPGCAANRYAEVAETPWAYRTHAAAQQNQAPGYGVSPGPVLPVTADVDAFPAPNSPLWRVAWDGINEGIWVTCPAQNLEPQNDAAVPADGIVALLIDPQTGDEKRRIVVGQDELLMGHDGVGLWFGQIVAGSNGTPQPRMQMRRIRTARSLPHHLRERGWSLPQDLENPTPTEPLTEATGDPESLMDQALPWPQAAAAWDGQRIWTLAPCTGPDGKPQLRLLAIDIGLTRKPDTTDRYYQVLAHEEKHGTLATIPQFDELIAYDPAAAEVRNHLSWALATRPNEPYHDLTRARQLVLSSLRSQPWNPEFWDTLAEIEWRMGNADKAALIEARAINLNPGKGFYWDQWRKFRGMTRRHRQP